MTAGTYQLQPKVLWGELHRAHGALGVDEHGALDPSCGTRATGTCTVELATVYVRCGYLLPDLDGAVEGGGGEDGAELGMRPAHFRDGRIMRLQRTWSGVQEGAVRGRPLRSERRAGA